jgi:RecB family exonuclease
LNQTVIDFFLTPDGPSGRRVRKYLAQHAPGLYRIAGPWPELVAQAHAAYLLPPIDRFWSEKLGEFLAQSSDRFWSGSFEVAPEETAAELDEALSNLIEGAGPDADWSILIKQLPHPSRIHTRISQLYLLLKEIGALPDSVQMMADLIDARNPPLRPIRVCHLQHFPELNAWQQAVLAKLAADAPPPDRAMQDLLSHALEPPATAHSSLLGTRTLFEQSNQPIQPDGSMRILATRDRLEEIEVAAGMIQKAFGQDDEMRQWGILLPNDAFTVQTIETVFNRCGLPLSGLERTIHQRDVGKEAVRLFLVCLRKPAPIMSIAALLTSPLMPWSMEDGHNYAQAVMKDDVLLKNSQLDGHAKQLMGLLDKGADTIETLELHFKRFRSLLESGDRLPDQRQRAVSCVDSLLLAIKGMPDTQWDRLLSITKPEQIYTTDQHLYWQEGVAVFHEGLEPWRNVNHLLVLGFNDGHFPSGSRASAVFTEAEWEQVASTGWAVTTAESFRKRQRDVFVRQLASACESLTLFFSRRDTAGDAMEPSSSLVFLARRFGCHPEDLVLELSRKEDCRQIPDLATALKDTPAVPRPLTIADIDLKVDLLTALGTDPDKPISLSPSAADTLMVSPLAWFLGRLDCEPRQWVTDELDPMTAGTLAHRVFEELFPAGEPLMDITSIRERAPVLLNQLTLQIAPFLRSPDWRVERLKLESEIIRAAERWRDLLASWGADVIGAEQWLKGVYQGIPLRGQSDLLLKLPSDKLLVVDYKKSSSGKRRNRMRSQFDLQANLYRLMIQTGGLPDLDTAPADIGVVYYLLNDQTALSDSSIPADGTVPGLEIIDSDISSAAMEHLDQRLAEIRSGKVMLNTTNDEKWWDQNASIPIYALDNSPLLRLFMHTAEESS